MNGIDLTLSILVFLIALLFIAGALRAIANVGKPPGRALTNADAARTTVYSLLYTAILICAALRIVA